MTADASAGGQHSACSTTDVSKHLAELQEWLQCQHGSGDQAAGTDSAAADAQLKQLRHVTAAIQQCTRYHSPQMDFKVSTDLQACAAAVACIELLTEVLLHPSEALYSGLSGAPEPPGLGLELAGEQQQLVASAQIQLLLQLVQLFADLEAPLPAEQPAAAAATDAADDDGRARNRPTYFQGIVEIEELPDDDDNSNNNSSSLSAQQVQLQLQQQLLQLLLVAALYAADSSCMGGAIQNHGTSPAAPQPATVESRDESHIGTGHSTAASSSCLLTQGMNSFCDSIVQQGLRLHSPWSGPDCQQHAQQLAQQLINSMQPGSAASTSRSKDHSLKQVTLGQHSVDPAGLAAAGQSHQHLSHGVTELPGTAKGSSDQQQLQVATQHARQQAGTEQQLWCDMLPLLLDKLRDTLLAQHRHKRLQEKGDMVSYSGPSTFSRCLAARQLSWLTQQLQPHALDEPQTLGLLLPLVLAVSEDPSPCVRQYGYAALGWLGRIGAGCAGGQHSSAGHRGLQWQADLLKEEARRLVVGCEESCWGGAMPAATSLMMALEGRDQRSTAYHSLLLELLQEAARSAHKPQPRLVFMGCVARLVSVLGLYVVRHLAALMPLLLEWVHAYDVDSSVVAMQLLGRLALHAWPRMGVHVVVIRQQVQQVVQQELVEQGKAAERQGLRQQQQQEEHGLWQGVQSGLQLSVASSHSRRYTAAVELLQLLDCWGLEGVPAVGSDESSGD